ncbi:unnamed protein product [Rotaria sp. Silwood2]|nr:unnamed protein product [Rotaria sp. Silwood2]
MLQPSAAITTSSYLPIDRSNISGNSTLNFNNLPPNTCHSTTRLSSCPNILSYVGRKAVDIARKRNIILLRDSGMSQHENSRRLNISRHCIRQTIRKFNELHTVATKPEAGRHSKLTDRRFQKDFKRFEQSQQRIHRSGDVGIWSYLTCHGLGPLVFYDGPLNSDKYIDILDKHLPTALDKFLPQSSHEILLQQDNARPHILIKTRKYFKEKDLNLIPWPANSADLNL